MKRASGEGTIRQLKSGNWCARVMINGVRKSHTATTQRKAREWLTEVRHDLDMETYVEPSDMPLSEWWDKWIIADKKVNVKAATLRNYAASRARLSKNLLAMPLSKITRADVQAAINRFTATGAKPSTAKLMAVHVNSCFKAAVIGKMIKNNPFNNIKLPEDEEGKGQLHLLTDEEYTDFVIHCKTTIQKRKDGKTDGEDAKRKPYKDALLTILYTGLRKAECINLLWSDWDKDVLLVRGTKTSKSYRRIMLDHEIIELLESRRKTTKSFSIFESTKGKPLLAAALYDHIHGLNGHNVHDLRHTFATRAILAGVDAKTLSEILGHANVSTTLKLYVHPTDDSKRDAVRKIASARSQQGNGARKVTVISE